jgi:hypothetical protein
VLKNTGTLTLELPGNPPVASSNPSAFSITTAPAKTELLPGESTPFTLRYAPQTAGPESADITIAGNIQSGTFRFKVQGTGGQVVPATPSITSATGDVHTVTQNVGAGIKRTYYPLTISWALSPGAENYKIYYATTASGFTSSRYVLVENSTVTTVTILRNTQTQYKYVKIAAVNGAGESAASAVREITKWTSSSTSMGSGSTTR